MAIWEENSDRYYARLHTLLYVCNNFWRFMLSKEDEFGDEYGEIQAVSFAYELLPPEARINPKDVVRIRTVLSNAWDDYRRNPQAFTIDDLLTELQWSFNPADIKDFKIQYREPNLPRNKKGKVKR